MKGEAASSLSPPKRLSPSPSSIWSPSLKSDSRSDWASAGPHSCLACSILAPSAAWNARAGLLDERMESMSVKGNEAENRRGWNST